MAVEIIHERLAQQRAGISRPVPCGLLIRPKTYAHHHTGAELGDEAILMIG
jgi:hypothetical protein